MVKKDLARMRISVAVDMIMTFIRGRRRKAVQENVTDAVRQHFNNTRPAFFDYVAMFSHFAQYHYRLFDRDIAHLAANNGGLVMYILRLWFLRFPPTTTPSHRRILFFTLTIFNFLRTGRPRPFPCIPVFSLVPRKLPLLNFAIKNAGHFAPRAITDYTKQLALFFSQPSQQECLIDASSLLRYARAHFLILTRATAHYSRPRSNDAA